LQNRRRLFALWVENLSLLRIEHRLVRQGPKELLTLGLTAREAEVLFWITEGKTEIQLAPRVQALRARGANPKLDTILVGEDPASATCVRMKASVLLRVFIEPERFALSGSATIDEVLEVINQCNADPDIYGILLQHPVPPQVDERACFDAIKLAKDVDGVTSLGFGRLALGALAYGSATPAGIMALLARCRWPQRSSDRT
jgi:5,10-methylene-tetrahydrofolate dehydrogenase/methenyl tetrahydrofolate cyclohydrolase